MKLTKKNKKIFFYFIITTIIAILIFLYIKNIKNKQTISKQSSENFVAVNSILSPSPTTEKVKFSNLSRFIGRNWGKQNTTKLVDQKETFNNNDETLTYIYKGPQEARFQSFSITYPDYWNLYLTGPVEKGEFVPYGGEYDLLFEDPKTDEYIGIYRISSETPYCTFKWQTYFYCEVEEDSKIELNMGKFYFNERAGNDNYKIWSLCEEIPHPKKEDNPCMNGTPVGVIFVYTHATGKSTQLPSYLYNVLNSIKVVK